MNIKLYEVYEPIPFIISEVPSIHSVGNTFTFELEYEVALTSGTYLFAEIGFVESTMKYVALVLRVTDGRSLTLRLIDTKGKMIFFDQSGHWVVSPDPDCQRRVFGTETVMLFEALFEGAENLYVSVPYVLISNEEVFKYIPDQSSIGYTAGVLTDL